MPPRQKNICTGSNDHRVSNFPLLVCHSDHECESKKLSHSYTYTFAHRLGRISGSPSTLRSPPREEPASSSTSLSGSRSRTSRADSSGKGHNLRKVDGIVANMLARKIEERENLMNRQKILAAQRFFGRQKVSSQWPFVAAPPVFDEDEWPLCARPAPHSPKAQSWWRETKLIKHELLHVVTIWNHTHHIDLKLKSFLFSEQVQVFRKTCFNCTFQAPSSLSPAQLHSAPTPATSSTIPSGPEGLSGWLSFSRIIPRKNCQYLKARPTILVPHTFVITPKLPVDGYFQIVQKELAYFSELHLQRLPRWTHKTHPDLVSKSEISNISKSGVANTCFHFPWALFSTPPIPWDPDWVKLRHVSLGPVEVVYVDWGFATLRYIATHKNTIPLWNCGPLHFRVKFQVGGVA